MDQEPGEPVRFPPCPLYPMYRSAYVILHPISARGAATLYKAICLPKKAHVAIKIIDLDSIHDRGNELTRMLDGARLVNPHTSILRHNCYFIDDNKLWVVMPYISGGSLQSIIQYAFPHGLRPKCIATVLSDVLTALASMHDQGYAHGGVKPGNILIDSNGHVLLSDLAVTSWNYEHETMFGPAESRWPSFPTVPPLYWVPPEALHFEAGFDEKADVWSVGVTALELFLGQPPIPEFAESKYIQMRIEKRFHFSDHYNKGKGKTHKKCPPSLKQFIEACLVHEPLERPSSEALLDHPFFWEKCRSEGYLIRHVLKGLPNVEKRFKPRIPGPVPDVDEADFVEEEYPRRRTQIGWTYKGDKLELWPVFRPGKVVIKDKESESEDTDDSFQSLDSLDTSDTLLAEDDNEIAKSVEEVEIKVEELHDHTEDGEMIVEELHRQEGDPMEEVETEIHQREGEHMEGEMEIKNEEVHGSEGDNAREEEETKAKKLQRREGDPTGEEVEAKVEEEEEVEERRGEKRGREQGKEGDEDSPLV